MKHQVHPTSKIYQYQLIKKVNWPAALSWFYFLIMAVAAALFAVICGVQIALWLAAGLPIVFLFQFLLHRFILIVFHHTSLQKWTFRVYPPLWGVIPDQYISIRRMVTIQLNLFFIGIVWIACFIPWIPIQLITVFLFLHVWTMLPGTASLFICYRAYPDGLLKFNPNDVSCYKS
ncbi:hypothetical protein [Marinicrinis lubricantis]|uniref:DUF4395 domain-containing protein n=1 Tax=Marinicrinis lubricantis TaxID=2086470 RepID=A0ABW1IQZ9_9BACL